jgi:hypothetical protein
MLISIERHSVARWESLEIPQNKSGKMNQAHLDFRFIGLHGARISFRALDVSSHRVA